MFNKEDAISLSMRFDDDLSKQLKELADMLPSASDIHGVVFKLLNTEGTYITVESDGFIRFHNNEVGTGLCQFRDKVFENIHVSIDNMNVNAAKYAIESLDCDVARFINEHYETKLLSSEYVHGKYTYLLSFSVYYGD